MRRVIGFSLIELMVVVAIVAMLSAVAVPSYGSYVTRSRVSSLLPLVDKVRNEVLEGHSLGTTYGNTTAVSIATNATNKPKFLNQLIRDTYGCVTVDYDVAQLGLSAGTLQLKYCPSLTSSGIISWNCGYSATTTVGYTQYLPTNCQQASVADTTF